MPYIAKAVLKSALDALLIAAGLTLKARGKVRHTYLLPGFPELMLLRATNRVSIFDLVLGFLIPQKGEVLTALTVFWHLLFQKAGIRTHMVAYGAGIDQYLPAELRGNAELQKSAIVVMKLKMVPVEAIARGYLTGSGLEAYLQTGEVCGNKLPAGLRDGSHIPYPIFTPTSKAKKGHDEHISAAEVNKKYPWMAHMTIRLYNLMHDYALNLGIILADTKFEFGLDPKTGEPVLGDEFGTPDSSRFWLLAAWVVTSLFGKSPSGWDKQPLREEGKRTQTPFGCTLNKLDPENRLHAVYAGEVVFSDETIIESRQRYVTLPELLTGYTLKDFQCEVMGIAA